MEEIFKRNSMWNTTGVSGNYSRKKKKKTPGKNNKESEIYFNFKNSNVSWYRKKKLIFIEI